MTIDVEDYFQVSAFDAVVRREDVGHRSQPRRRQHRAPARDLRRAQVKATFFVLGWVAERFPSLVSQHRRGRPRTGVARLRRTARLRPDAGRVPRRRAPRQAAHRGGQSGQPVRGYRAPSYSITRQIAVGARRARRGGLRLRRAASFRSATIATASPTRRAIRTRSTARPAADRGAALDRAPRPDEPAQSPAAATSACCRTPGPDGASRASTSAKGSRRSSTCTRGRSTRTSRGCRRAR